MKPRNQSVMTAERRDAYAARRAAARQARATPIGRYLLFQCDEFNWGVSSDGTTDPERFYPDLPSALDALLRLDIGARHRQTLESLTATVRDAQQAVLRAALQATETARVIPAAHSEPQQAGRDDVADSAPQKRRAQTLPGVSEVGGLFG